MSTCTVESLREAVHELMPQLQADLEQLEPAMEKLRKVADLVVYHLLLVEVVIGLEVDASIRDEEKTLDLD